MKKSILLITLILTAVIIVNAQDETPIAPATPVLRDDNIKLRSVELERVKRDSLKKQPDAATTTAINNDIEKKYPEIKEDFEGMQLSQAAIIKAYTTGKTIDYAMIEASAKLINKNAKRLHSNLFTEKIKEKKKEEDEEVEQTKSVRDLIIDLDDAIGKVISSKMFLNLRVIDPAIALKTQFDVERIQKLSTELSLAAKKMK